MKPTEKQKLVINNLISLIGYWKNTNDIMSPSHHTLIEEELMSTADDLGMEYDDEKIKKLEDVALDLLFAIRKFS